MNQSTDTLSFLTCSHCWALEVVKTETRGNNEGITRLAFSEAGFGLLHLEAKDKDWLTTEQ